MTIIPDSGGKHKLPSNYKRRNVDLWDSISSAYQELDRIEYVHDHD